jgi:broad specificity phosphatase PhoE
VALYASPMRRAKETAQPIADRLGQGMVIDSRLRERMNWAGTGDETLASFLADWAMATADRTYVPASGDSSLQAARRFVGALDEIAVRHGCDDTVVVVTHGGITTDFLRTLLGDAELTRRSPSLIDSGVPCGAATRLIRGTDDWSDVAIASTDHLEESSDHRPV